MDYKRIYVLILLFEVVVSVHQEVSERRTQRSQTSIRSRLPNDFKLSLNRNSAVPRENNDNTDATESSGNPRKSTAEISKINENTARTNMRKQVDTADKKILNIVNLPKNRDGQEITRTNWPETDQVPPISNRNTRRNSLRTLQPNENNIRLDDNTRMSEYLGPRYSVSNRRGNQISTIVRLSEPEIVGQRNRRHNADYSNIQRRRSNNELSRTERADTLRNLDNILDIDYSLQQGSSPTYEQYYREYTRESPRRYDEINDGQNSRYRALRRTPQSTVRSLSRLNEFESSQSQMYSNYQINTPYFETGNMQRTLQPRRYIEEFERPYIGQMPYFERVPYYQSEDYFDYSPY